LVGTKFLWSTFGVFAEFSDTIPTNFPKFTLGVSYALKKYIPTPPASRPYPVYPAPTPQYSEPEPPPVVKPQAGTVYYQYNGIGYVYFNESVFYLCANGRPVGYLEGDIIYAFSGKVLGFYAHPFIHDRQGNTIGADDPKKLGTDAAAKRQVSKAAQQDVPVKGPQQFINKPRLKNAYYGGLLSDIF
jgi:hypothetical protein